MTELSKAEFTCCSHWSWIFFSFWVSSETRTLTKPEDLNNIIFNEEMSQRNSVFQVKHLTGIGCLKLWMVTNRNSVKLLLLLKGLFKKLPIFQHLMCLHFPSKGVFFLASSKKNCQEFLLMSQKHTARLAKAKQKENILLFSIVLYYLHSLFLCVAGIRGFLCNFTIKHCTGRLHWCLQL